jgi:hypothetical protein
LSYEESHLQIVTMLKTSRKWYHDKLFCTKTFYAKILKTQDVTIDVSSPVVNLSMSWIFGAFCTKMFGIDELWILWTWLPVHCVRIIVWWLWLKHLQFQPIFSIVRNLILLFLRMWHLYNLHLNLVIQSYKPLTADTNTHLHCESLFFLYIHVWYRTISYTHHPNSSLSVSIKSA